jgi:protein-tyrosine phosphatase
MVDIHSHILPGIDDGSTSMEISVEMLLMAAESGTTDIVATPHKNTEYVYNEEVIAPLFRELSDRFAGIINLHLGCDFHLSLENIHEALANPSKYTINGKGYLMSELPNLSSLGAMRTVFGRLIQRGITPVITHPERIRAVQTQLDDLKEWIRDGCYMQVTAQSFVGRFGKRSQSLVETLVDEDLVHFVASDGHDTKDRVPVLKQAYELVSRRWGVEKADALFIKNPTAALTGERLRSSSPSREKKTPLFSFLRR